ncbi:hypothetical protein JRO89_XS07G0252800 [Xanthoceras sorbifolium]|uniref:Uncharacterized protein n=1 Tax=Xanthoceras sorbifolium TaxID=99658 RepID=A0ABQ8HUZ5_9ROSI|nr:hypothetical protein JRO89_XS07G0252800 [Xanthoceras sorbifolium]
MKAMNNSSPKFGDWLRAPTPGRPSSRTQGEGNEGGKSSTQNGEEASRGKQVKETSIQIAKELTNIESTMSSEGEKATLDNLGKALVCHGGRDSREEKEPSNNHGKGNKVLCAVGERKRVADKATKRTVGEMVIRTEAMTKRDTASKLGQGQKAGLYNGPDPLNGEIDNAEASPMEGVSHDPGPYPSSTKKWKKRARNLQMQILSPSSPIQKVLSTRRRGKHGSRSPARRILYNKISPPVSPKVGSKRKGEGISTDDRPLKPIEVLLDSAAGFLIEFHNTISAVSVMQRVSSNIMVLDDYVKHVHGLELVEVFWERDEMDGGSFMELKKIRVLVVPLTSEGRQLPLQNQGAIPEQLAYYGNLTLIDLSVNNLSGFIPDRIGELSKLEVLILSSSNLMVESQQTFQI